MVDTSVLGTDLKRVGVRVSPGAPNIIGDGVGTQGGLINLSAPD